MHARNSDVFLRGDREIAATRTFDAPRNLVFRMWTDPEHITHWWGPRGFATTTRSMDLRPGGAWRFVMHGPDGRDYENLVQYTEVVPDERLAYRHVGLGQDDAVRFEVTVTFADDGPGRTRIDWRMTFPSPADRDLVVREYGADRGLADTVARLGERIEGLAFADEELVIRRTFDAPRDLVFRAWTDADHLARWWGPRGYTCHSGKLDLRPGGSYHYGMTSADGHAMWGLWTIREVVPPQRLVWENSFSDEKGQVARAPFAPDFPLRVLSTAIFAEHEGGGTLLTLRAVPLDATEAERKVFKGMHGSMQKGWGGSLDQLAEHLKSDPSRKECTMMPEPQAEHRWLQKLVGDWTYESECSMGPDKPAARSSGTESVRSLGDLWIVGEGQGEMPGGGGLGRTILTLGYDPARGKYVGSWIGSMMTLMWTYEGTRDAGGDGNVLTLDTEGPNFADGGKTRTRFQDIITIVSDDHRTLTSRMLGPDGQWHRFTTAHYHRRKQSAVGRRPIPRHSLSEVP